MTESTTPDPPTRYAGRVDRLRENFGFIVADGLADVYFRPSWFRGEPPLREGEEVTFEIKTFGDRLQAHNLARSDDNVAAHADYSSELPTANPPATEQLLQWAYLGYQPNALRQLKSLALKERWEFKNTPEDPDRPAPILRSYLLQTFARLVLEEKVLINSNRTFAAFNTGLVDPRYEPIYALFAPNANSRLP